VTGIELRSVDVNEYNEIEQFVKMTCGCKLSNGGPCSNLFIEKFCEIRAQCQELNKESLDYILLGQIMALTNTSRQITSRKRSATQRFRQSYSYSHEGIKVSYT
jgi:hypothetical protein